MNNRLDKEEIQLSLLRLLENNPELTQRGKLTFNLLKKKIREYDDLKEEIKTLNDLFKKTDTDTNDSELNRHLKRIID